MVGNRADGGDAQKCGDVHDGSGKKRIEIKCPKPLQGRYVRVVIPNGILTLCEVQVMGTKTEAPWPHWPQDFAWSSAGRVTGKVCTQILEPADPHTWSDNYFCWTQGGRKNLKISWSNSGSIPGMRCTQIHEGADPHNWSNNYLCVPHDSPYNFRWSSAGPISGLQCVQWVETSDPHTWTDNYLCGEKICNPKCINGKCTNGKCVCSKGWSGAACDKNYGLHSEHSYPAPHIPKGHVQTTDDCADLCRGKYNYFGIGRKGSNSCNDHLGCYCMCGEGKYFGKSPTFDTYKFVKAVSSCRMIYERDGGCPNYGRVRIVNGILDVKGLAECNEACLKNAECVGFIATTGRCWLVKKGCTRQTQGNVVPFKYYIKSCN